MDLTYPPSSQFKNKANLSLEQYQAWYAESIEQPEKFWAARAEQILVWQKPSRTWITRQRYSATNRMALMVMWICRQRPIGQW